MNEKNTIDINFGALLDSLIKRLWLILLVAVIAAGIAYVNVSFFVEPLYSSTATLYVGNTASLNDLNSSEALAKDYEEIIKRRTVLNPVIERLSLDMTSGQLASCVSVMNISDTRLLDITVSTPDPALSKDIADAICTVGSEQFVSLVNVDYVSIIDTGNLSVTPSNINLPLSMFLAAFAGILVTAFFIMVRTIMDDKIKTPDDVERYLGLSVLGTTPFNKDLESDNLKKKSLKRRLSGRSRKGSNTTSGKIANSKN